MEDNLLRIFASDGVKNLMRRLGMERGEAIENSMVTRSIEKAQRKVEGRNFDIRKQLLEYDNVANDQRTIIYRQRNELMARDEILDLILDMRVEVINQLVDQFVPPNTVAEQWDIEGLEQNLNTELSISLPIQAWLEDDEELYEEHIKAKVIDAVTNVYDEKSKLVGEKIRSFEKQIMLQILDSLWKEHLAVMDGLRQGIFLRSYGGKNPPQEYKREAFALFQDLLTNLQHEVIKVLSHVQIREDDSADAVDRRRAEELKMQKVNFQHQKAPELSEGNLDETSSINGNAKTPPPFVRQVPKVGRNEPCPCGSGKKYKACCGKLV
jgi:preprotein translocase subunit SecA